MLKYFFIALFIFTGILSAAIPSVNPVLPSNKKYDYEVIVSTYAPRTLTFYGIGNSWIFSVAGGTATFKVNNGKDIELPQEMTMGNDFNSLPKNPTLTLVDLQKGATAFLFIDGVK